MTTAREKLYEEVVAMVASPAGPSAEAEMRKVMSRYRVQTKPGVDVAPGATARDALGDRLLELWRGQPEDIKTKIGNFIDEFRMQLKSASSSAPAKAPAPRPRPAVSTGGPPPPAVTDDEEEPSPALRPRPARDPAPARPAALAASEPPSPSLRARPSRATAEPVAGGPRKRGRSRGECPKCHSMGVVLARSYSGDEYFSCIYCGWQAYKPADENDANASLAVKLLGQTPSESTSE